MGCFPRPARKKLNLPVLRSYCEIFILCIRHSAQNSNMPCRHGNFIAALGMKNINNMPILTSKTVSLLSCVMFVWKKGNLSEVHSRYIKVSQSQKVFHHSLFLKKMCQNTILEFSIREWFGTFFEETTKVKFISRLSHL